MKYIILTLGIISIVSLNSCTSDDFSNIETSKADILDKNYIQKASMKEKLAYKKYYLREALKEVTKMGFTFDDLVALSKDSKYQKDVVLFSDILSYAKSKKKINIEADQKIEKISNAFKELDGSNYDISFYIPFADKLNNNSISNKTIESDIYIFEQEDNSEQLAFEGEVLNEDGEFVTYDQLITEQMAEDLAEQQGRKVVIVGLADFEAINTGGNGGYEPLKNHLNMIDMAIKTHKESWIAGKSDIAIVAMTQRYGEFYYTTVPPSEFAVLQFWNVKRKDVRKQTLFNVNKSLSWIDRFVPSPGFISNTDNNFALHYVIFEQDNWPTGNRTKTFVHEGKSYSITYRSSDEPYDYRTLIGHNAPSSYIDNSEIKYRVYFGSKLW